MQILRSYTDAYAPRVFVEADGEFAQDLLNHTIKFTFSDDEKKADEIRLTVANPYHKFIEDPRLKSGIRFRCTWGYPNDMSPVRDVIIAAVKPSFPSGGMPTIELVAYDVRFVLAKGARPCNWGPVSSSEVARRIAAKLGLQTDITESNDARKQSRIQPANTTDMAYLMSLCTKLNYDCYIEGNTLHFHETRYNEPPVATVTYFVDMVGSIIEFSPEINMNKPTSVAKVAVDPKTSTSSAQQAASSSNGAVKAGGFTVETQLDNGQAIGLNVYKKPQDPITQASPETSKTVASKQAKAMSNKLDIKAVKASLKIVGSPRVKSKTMIRVLNVGQTLSGNWRIASSTHTISATGEYVTECQLSRNALNKGKTAVKAGEVNNANSSSASGPRGNPVYSSSDGVNISPTVVRR